MLSKVLGFFGLMTKAEADSIIQANVNIVNAQCQEIKELKAGLAKCKEQKNTNNRLAQKRLKKIIELEKSNGVSVHS